MPRLPKLQLTRPEALELRAQAKVKGVAEVQCRAILLLHEGRKPGEVAKELEVSRQVLNQWQRVYRNGGIEALIKRSRRGRGDRLSAEVMDRIRRLAMDGNGGRRPAAGIAEEVGVSLPSVYRVLKEADEFAQDAAPSGPGKDRGKKGASTVEGEDTSVFPTIRSVAARAGVSPSTVSNVLNERRGVSAAVRERVLAAVEATGYRRHPYVSMLMGRIRENRIHSVSAEIAWIHAGALPMTRNRATAYGEWQLFQSARDRAAKLGFELSEIWMNGRDMTADRVKGIIEARGIQGVVSEKSLPPELATRLSDLSSVALTSSRAGSGIRVGVDTTSALLNVVKILWQRGYRRAGLIYTEAMLSVDRYSTPSALGYAQFKAGVTTWIPPLEIDREVLNIYDLAKGISPRTSGSFSFGNRKREWVARARRYPIEKVGIPTAMREFAPELIGIWNKRHRLDAVITCFGDTREWLGIAGIRVPQDLGLVHVNWNEDVAGWAGIRRDYQTMGRTAIDLLLNQMGRQFTPAHDAGLLTLVPPLWVEGETLPVRVGASQPPFMWEKGFLRDLKPLEIYTKTPHDSQ